MSEELLSLTSAGHLPGLPGSHGPGTYLVDYAAQTIRRATPDGEPLSDEPERAPDGETEQRAPDSDAPAAEPLVEPSPGIRMEPGDAPLTLEPIIVAPAPMQESA